MLAFCTLAGAQEAQQEHKFRDTSLSFEERVEHLISILTPEEKVGLMMNKAISVDRLGIPSYNWWSEACHGVVKAGYTVYPQPIGMAAAFNPEMIYDVFSQVSDEARANWNRSEREFNVAMGAINYPGNPELTFWCPNVNIFRDPRWGRGQESYGEDPYLNAILGVQNVLGMQGNDDKYFKTHACAKHYAVHSGPEPLRHSYNASVSMRDLWETYLPAFKALVQKGNVREVMCAYNRYEGEPCCSSDRLLVDILRRKWGFDGIVLTDCDAINNFYRKGQHETHPDALSASVDAVLNGTDLECGRVFQILQEGLEKGLIKEDVLDGHLRRTLYGRFELGMFDPAEMLPWAGIAPDVISSEEHHQLAVQAARESMVLLENKGGILPLSKNLRKIAVVGPNAHDTALLDGNYAGSPTPEHTASLLDGIRKAVPGTEVYYNMACPLNDNIVTITHLHEFNDGKGVYVEFYNNKNLEGTPDVTGYYDKLNFSTFGAYGFADGVNTEDLSIRVTGKYTATFTGTMRYNITTDNGYTLQINGETIDQTTSGRGRGGFGRQVEYKSFDVIEGQTYDVKIEYKRGTDHFATFRADICERNPVEYETLAKNVADADVIIVIGGISAQMEGEGGDKATIELPEVQRNLIRAMHATGKPVVVVNCSGSAIAFGCLEGQYDALIQAWYPGQGGSQALAEIIFGDHNPGGKLPVTFYASNDDLPDFLDYSMENRTYRYFRGVPQYAFGYGLSYTTFEVGKGKISKKSMKADETVKVTVPVKNTGEREGTETIQVYVKALDYPEAPIKSLKGFKKVYLEPGETVKTEIILDGESFQYYDPSIDELSTRPGRYQILYGTSSLDKDLKSIDFEVR
ncbi:MAG: glycoside hydrolase family 3 C-terminal domain-containing protein [Bacteroidales bacterium]|nr:glycoside hydrolase family 3 C-terminal domain-containing protein [Bacteroidales bacterium]